MFKDVQDPLLQLRVLFDFRIILVVVGEHSLNKPGGMKQRLWYEKNSEQRLKICTFLIIRITAVASVRLSMAPEYLTKEQVCQSELLRRDCVKTG